MEKKVLTNDENLENYKKRKVLRWAIIVFGIITITLAMLSLTIKLGVGYALIAFIIMTVLTKIRESIPLKDNDEEKELIEEKLNNKKGKEQEKKKSSSKVSKRKSVKEEKKSNKTK